MRSAAILTALAGAATFAVPAWAQGTESIDLKKLTTLYDNLLTAREKNQDTATAEERIAEERLRLRKLIDDEIRVIIRLNEDADVEIADLQHSLDRQRAVIDALQERERNKRADFALLQSEIEAYEEGGEDALADRVSITQSHAEALARSAFAQDTIDIVGQMLSVQDQRMQELRREQQAHRFGAIFSIVQYLLILLGVFWIEHVVRISLLTRIPHRTLRYAVTKTFTFVVYLTVIFWFIEEIFTDNPTILAGLAVAGAAVVISLQDVIKGLVGFLANREMVKLGKRVTIGELTGDVIDRGLLHTTLLLTKTGDNTDPAVKDKIAMVPNALLLTQPVVSLHSTSDFIRVEITLTVTDTTRWREAKTILESIILEHTKAYVQQLQRQIRMRMRNFYVDQEYTGAVVFTEISNEGVLFTLCFPAPIGKRRVIVTAVNEQVLDRFAEAGIAIAANKTEETAPSRKHGDDPEDQAHAVAERPHRS